MTCSSTYLLAQRAIADLKGAVVALLESSSERELSNAQIGRALGIYGGHIGHEGHISRTLLEQLRSEGVVTQDSNSKQWRLKKTSEGD